MGSDIKFNGTFFIMPSVCMCGWMDGLFKLYENLFVLLCMRYTSIKIHICIYVYYIYLDVWIYKNVCMYLDIPVFVTMYTCMYTFMNVFHICI